METVEDVGFVAFLKIVKNVHYASVPRKIKRRFAVSFDITQEQLDEYQKEYLNSPYRDFNNELRYLTGALRSDK